MTCVCSIIATILTLIGIILLLLHARLYNVAAHMWYFSAVNFILFAILFHFAGAGPEPEKKV